MIALSLNYDGITLGSVENISFGSLAAKNTMSQSTDYRTLEILMNEFFVFSL